jgi:hypothetical protein
MDDEEKWEQLRPALEDALQSGPGADHKYLSATALDAAFRALVSVDRFFNILKKALLTSCDCQFMILQIKTH